MISASLILTSMPADALTLRPMAFGVKIAMPRYQAAYQQKPVDIDMSKMGLISDIMLADENGENRRQAAKEIRSLVARISIRAVAYLVVSFVVFIGIKFNIDTWLAVFLGGTGIIYDITMNLLPDIEQGYADAKAREISRRSYQMASINSHARVYAVLKILYDAPDKAFTQEELIKYAKESGFSEKLSPENVARVLEFLCKLGYVSRVPDEVGIDGVSSSGPVKSSSAGKAETAIKSPSSAEDIPNIISEVCERKDAYTRNRIFGDSISGFDRTRLYMLLSSLIYYKDLSSIPLPEQEVLYLLNKALSKALSGRYRKDFIIDLKEMLLRDTAALPPKSRVLIESYITIAEIHKPTIVTTVYAMHGEQTRVQSPLDKLGGEDAFKLKVQQKEDLYNVNPLVDWRMIAVNDGDDKRFSAKLKSSDITRFLLRRFYPQYSSLSDKGIPKIQVVELEQDTRDAIGSVKGGAIIYGMRKALNDGADYIISTDQDGSISLAEEGVLLKPILTGEADASLGLRHGHPAAVDRPFARRLKHHAFLMFAKLNIPQIAQIKDTQVGFKAFSRDLLSKILPLSIEGGFDPQFEYGGSFDVNLLGRAKKAGANIAQVAVCYFESEASRFSGIPKALAMAKGIRRIRRYLGQWSVPVSNELVPAVFLAIDSAA